MTVHSIIMEHESCNKYRKVATDKHIHLATVARVRLTDQPGSTLANKKSRR